MDGPVHVRIGVAAEAESMAAVILLILPAAHGRGGAAAAFAGLDPLAETLLDSALRQRPAVVGRMESAVHFQNFAVPSSLLT
ncbi:hypothetical protein DQ353_15395 [Arthrobacter sp. AQ5-05]|nr:hypothetical protein DQ353_15395 [Arthrobacter sp. AQ5-05]